MEMALYCSSCGAEQSGNATCIRCLACGSATGQASTCPGCNRPFTHPYHRLVFDTGSMAKCVFQVPEGIFSVGRPILCPRDQAISRCHLRIACLNGVLHIEDASSTHETYVDGRLADAPVAIQPGQRIRIAGSSAIYTSSSRSPS